MAALVCGFLVLSALVSLAQCSQIRATISPATPSAFNGRNLTMDCTLKGDIPSDVSANDLYFSWTNPELNERSGTHVIDSRSVRLTISKVYPNMSSSRISCHLGNYSLDEVAIVVDVPRFPSDPECVVYNWENMTCLWETDENDNTTVSLAYSRLMCNGQRYLCPHPFQEPGRGSCTFRALEALNAFMLVKHCLYYLVKNAFNVTARGRAITVMVDNIVKPNPPVKFNSSEATSNHVDLKWMSPYDTKSILYRITYESRLTGVLVQNTTATSLRLSNLIPATKYIVSIDCIPTVRDVAAGFWSDKSTLQVTTEPDVPGNSPSVTPGGFLVFDVGQFQRKIKLFFQPVSDFHSNGEVKGYRVRYTTRNSASELETVDLKTNVVLSLEKQSTYNVSVEMQNVVGYNKSLLLKTIVISRQSELPAFPKNFFVQTDDQGTYLLNWTPVDHATSYTLYWCNSNLRQFECKNPLDWKILPSNQTSEVLQVVGLPDLIVRFALSVEKVTPSGETVSSGMLIANCTFSTSKELKPPERVTMMQTDRDTVTIYLSRPDRTATFDKCAGMAYASHYLVSYCPVLKNRCKETEKTLMVESYRESVSIGGLKEEETYDFRIQSLSENGNSSVAAFIGNATVPEEKAFPVAVVIVVVAIVCVAIGAIPIVVRFVRWWKKKWHIDVKTPPKYVNGTQAVAGELNGYSHFLRSDLYSNGKVQTKVCDYGHRSYFNSALQPGEDESLLSEQNSGYKSSTSSSQLSPIPSLQTSSASSQFSETHRDSGISASISGYNVVIEQPCENSGASPGSSTGTKVPHDDAFVTPSEN